MDRGPGDPASPEVDRREGKTSPGRVPPLLAHVFLFFLLLSQGSAGCRVDHCTREYQMELGEQGVVEPGPTAAFCLVLRKYGDCIRATARSCRGNLKYHSTYSTLSNWISEYNCSSQSTSAAGMRPTAATALPPAHDLPCTFRGSQRYRHCSLSGDPHLKSFHNEYMTCRIQGAWPLIDNPYLAVQVTNEAVTRGSPATATTKVTVIVKGRANTGCTSQKTYEATGDSPLPSSFIDGSRRSGPSEAVSLLLADGGSRVEIRLRHADATLVIRRLGKYLAFAARMPEEVAIASSGTHHPQQDEGLQLCVGGCPASERLHSVPGKPLLPPDAAEKRCRRWNLTDHYLDWCVFDSLTAPSHHEVDLAAAAAYAALADVHRLDPEGAALTLKNRTAARMMTGTTATPQGEGLASSAAHRPATPNTVVLALAVLAVLVGASSCADSGHW